MLFLNRIGISDKAWKTLKKKIEKSDATKEIRIARTELLSYRMLTGYYRVENWMQIRPLAKPLVNGVIQGGLPIQWPSEAHYPFSVEISYYNADLPLLEAHRLMKAVLETTLLLTAFIDIPIFRLQGPFTWLVSEGKNHLVKCGLISGLQDESNKSFSTPTGCKLMEPVEFKEYYDQLGALSKNFRIPNLQELHRVYTTLSLEDKSRFLRSCSALANSIRPGIPASERLLGAVSAIEPLITPGGQCEKCKSITGMTQNFKKFVEDYVRPTSEEARYLYEEIYNWRSKLTHGVYRYEVDESIFDLKTENEFDSSIIAWSAAKRGIVNWLLNHKSDKISD